MTKEVEKAPGKMRKTVVFSKKNADVFEVLTEMQLKNENISEYLCDLVRKDLNPIVNDTVNKEEFDCLNNKVDTIMELLNDIKNNNIVVKTEEVVKEDENKGNFEYLTEADEQQGDFSIEDIDDTGMFG